MKISGTERALPGEKIFLNISVLKEGISRVLLDLSPELRLFATFNYDLHKKNFSQKKLTFELKDFKFENNLTLGFLSKKLENDHKYTSIEIKAMDIENNLKEMSIFDIEILKPEINVEIAPGENPDELFIKLEKVNKISTYFRDLNVSAIDLNKKKIVKVDSVRFSEEEFVDNLDKIPIIFDIDSAIKKIIIHSNSSVELSLHARYYDTLSNEYESNKATIILHPFVEELEEKEFITVPIFNTIGFELPEIAMAVS